MSIYRRQADTRKFMENDRSQNSPGKVEKSRLRMKGESITAGCRGGVNELRQLNSDTKHRMVYCCRCVQAASFVKIVCMVTFKRLIFLEILLPCDSDAKWTREPRTILVPTEEYPALIYGSFPNLGTPKSSILIGFLITNKFWGTLIYGTPHIVTRSLALKQALCVLTTIKNQVEMHWMWRFVTSFLRAPWREP